MRKKYIWTGIIIGAVMLQLTGCGASTYKDQESSSAASIDGETEQVSQNGKEAQYDKSDETSTWDLKSVNAITCSGTSASIKGEGVSEENGVITIKKAGAYVLEGTYQGQIVIDAGKEDEVYLILNGFHISCDNSSPIYGIQSKKMIITLAEGTENTVVDGKHYQFASEGEDEPDAAVFSKDDITINGSGTLEVNGNYANGIRSKDTVKLMSGTVKVTAVKDGIKGKDAVCIKDGQIKIESGEDGIKSNNDTDSDKGCVIIDGGTIQILAGDDGIHAETWLSVHAGTILIEKSNEGMEGMRIDINGGTVEIHSEDDGINAAGGSDGTEEEKEKAKWQANPEIYVRISGGSVLVDAKADGIDSNGDVYVDGGTTYISGPEEAHDAALDYNGTSIIRGGTFVAAGSAGMMQAFSEESDQNMILVYYDDKKEAGTKVALESQEGEKLFEYTPEKSYECVLISLPELKQGETYQLITGDDSQEITLSKVLTQIGETLNRGPGGKPGGTMPGGNKPEGSMPDGGMPRGNMPRPEREQNEK